MAYGGYGNDALDRFQQQQQYSAYSAYPATPKGPAEYGQPGSFAGRKSVQPPGGFSSISFGDANMGWGGGGGSVSSGAYGNKSNYSIPAAYGAPAQQQGYGQQADMGGYAPYRQSRSISQPQPMNYGAQASFGGGFGAAGAGYGAPTPSAYGASQGLARVSTGYGSGYGAPMQPPTPSYGGGGYGGASGFSSGYNAAPTPQYNMQPQGQWNGNIGMYGPALAAQFHVQKGAFCGKTITQPPGGRSSITFG